MVEGSGGTVAGPGAPGAGAPAAPAVVPSDPGAVEDDDTDATGTPDLTAAIEAFAPQWCLFWGRSIPGYHLDIWMPYIRRSQYRFAVLSATDKASDEARRMIAAEPNCMLIEPYGAAIPALKQLRGFKGFLYIGTKERNFVLVNKFGTKSHIWVGHGESDKVTSAMRTASLYDSIFMARYAAADRYPRAIRRTVKAGALAIGTSIVEGIRKDRWTHPRPIRRVLYAPTWEGNSAAADYCSLLDVVPGLVAAMPELTARGIELVVRPHPITGLRVPEYKGLLAELFAAGARQGGAKAEDFTWCDVMISDISGVTAEFLFTEKPIILPASGRLASVGKPEARLQAEYPFAYLWNPTARTLADQLAQIEASDPKRGARATAAKRMFKGHESLEDAARTFDTALSVVRLRAAPVPLRWLFETKRRVGPLLGIVRRARRAGGSRSR
jgi:hypothetical protein